MLNGYTICFRETCNALVLSQRTLSVISVILAERAVRFPNTIKLVLIEHRNVHFATPAPEDLHGVSSLLLSSVEACSITRTHLPNRYFDSGGRHRRTA